MVKLYFKLALLLFVVISVFGVAAPFLISAANTELVLAGYALIVVTLPLMALAIKDIFNQFKTIFNINKEK